MLRSMRWVALAAVAVALLLFEVHLELSRRTAEGRDQRIGTLRQTAESFLPDEDQTSVAPLATTVASPSPSLPAKSGTATNWRELFEQWESRRQEDQGFTQWDEVRRILEGVEQRRGFPALDDEQLALVNESLDANEDILASVVSLTKRGTAFPAVSTASEEIELAGRLNEFSTLLDADAVRSSRSGRYGRAVECVTAKTVLTKGSRYLNYPGSHTALHIVDEALRNTTVREPYWDDLLAQLEDTRGHDRFVKELARDSVRVVNRYARFPMSKDAGIADNPVAFVERWTYRYPGAPVYNRHLSTFSESMAKILNLASKPYHEVADQVEELASSLPTDGTLLAKRCHWVSALRRSARDFTRQAYHEANIDLTRLAIQLERYRATYGAYPEDLDGLATYLGAELPTDPLSGRPYRYERTARRYRLYALGPKAQPGEDGRVMWPGSL